MAINDEDRSISYDPDFLHRQPDVSTNVSLELLTANENEIFSRKFSTTYVPVPKPLKKLPLAKPAFSTSETEWASPLLGATNIAAIHSRRLLSLCCTGKFDLKKLNSKEYFEEELSLMHFKLPDSLKRKRDLNSELSLTNNQDLSSNFTTRQSEPSNKTLKSKRRKAENRVPRKIQPNEVVFPFFDAISRNSNLIPGNSSSSSSRSISPFQD